MDVPVDAVCSSDHRGERVGHVHRRAARRWPCWCLPRTRTDAVLSACMVWLLPKPPYQALLREGDRRVHHVAEPREVEYLQAVTGDLAAEIAPVAGLHPHRARATRSPMCVGRKPTRTGWEGVLRSTKAVPVRVPTTAYSFPFNGSVQPHTSATLVLLPSWATVIWASRSIPSHG
jgi:hypothetical protein